MCDENKRIIAIETIIYENEKISFESMPDSFKRNPATGKQQRNHSSAIESLKVHFNIIAADLRSANIIPVGASEIHTREAFDWTGQTQLQSECSWRHYLSND